MHTLYAPSWQPTTDANLGTTLDRQAFVMRSSHVSRFAVRLSEERELLEISESVSSVERQFVLNI
jgi:hypothetical protein